MAFKDGVGMTEELKVELVDPPSKHELVLEFGRFLSEDEWRQVVDKVKSSIPYVQGLRAEAK